ncbi:hypothetical protein HD554DRAFT_2328774 [Boletus coccyginus]|nr:hypothetical protein HD554DRAFT_2328774 [Boletus coccyginus]
MESELDDKVNRHARQLIPPKLDPHDEAQRLAFLYLLQQIAQHSNGQLYGDNAFTLEKLVDAEKGPLLREKLAKAWDEKKYKSIRDIDYLRISITPSGSQPSMQAISLKVMVMIQGQQLVATEKAWNVHYVGDVATVLCNRIKDSLLGSSDDDTRSSGMGKSRAVDEMAKGELVIPMVLRPENSTDSSPGVFQRVLAFLHALFVVLAEVVESTEAPSEGLAPLNKLKPFAGQFREYMNHNMTMTCHGDFRVWFYNRVVEKAGEVFKTYERQIPLKSDTTCPDVDNKARDPSFLLNMKCGALLTALKAFQDPSWFIILSFDEMHVLGDNYLEFRCALRAPSNQPVFSLFLSTAGHMYNFIPNPKMDPSARMVERGRVVAPFAELGFDHFAKRTNLANEDPMETDDILTHVSSTAQLVKFGRPMWATRYDEGNPAVQADIIGFAASKLLGGLDPTGETPLELPHHLGCLAQRLPIEFLSSSYSSSLADSQSVQVQSHLRVVLRIADALETMITMTPSEPILSEAAYWLMSGRCKPATALKGILGGFSVDPGDRGELLVMLLLTIARDKAVGLPDRYGVPLKGFRWCSVKSFLSCLFVESALTDAIGDKQSAMEEVFGDSKLYFNHFVKVHEFEMLNTKYITRLMTRGAAILCANNQKGVDLVIPFTRGGLMKKDLGVILVQVKNNKTYTAEPKPDEFDSMSVNGLSDIPTLRLFFALAAKRDRLVTDNPSPPSHAFNFWIAGLSSKILRPIEDEGDSVWKGLLDASYGWEERYIEHGRSAKRKGDREKLTNIRRSMYPGGATADAHWRSWCDEEQEEQEQEQEQEQPDTSNVHRARRRRVEESIG